MRGPERSAEPEGLGRVLQALLRGRPWASGLVLGELGRRWSSVVGDRLSAECRPIRLESGVLFIRASSSAWATQLSFLSGEVRTRANGVLGGEPIREVKVVVGQITPREGDRRRGR